MALLAIYWRYIRTAVTFDKRHYLKRQSLTLHESFDSTCLAVSKLTFHDLFCGCRYGRSYYYTSE
jgi:hypothetical protein